MDMEHLASIFEAVKVLPLRPTDKLVFRAHRVLSEEQAIRAKAYLENVLGVPVVVLDSSGDLEIIRPETVPK